MSHEITPGARKKLVIKLAVLAGVAAIGAAVLLRGVDVRGLIEQTKLWLQGMGPTAFFSAVAVLPAAGFPASMFTLPAGPVFAPQLGLGVVIALMLLSMAVNLALTYWLARYALRPLLAGLIRRMGYQVPVVPKGKQIGLTLLVRITPGPPFFAQSYLLGLAEIPFKTYMLVSWPVAAVYWTLAIILGDSLMKGKGGLVVVVVVALVVLGAGVKKLRSRLAAKQAVSSSSA